MIKRLGKNRRFTYQDHTFVICAYKESPYLEGSIQCCLSQSEYGPVCIATSTPNAYIQKLADKYGLQVYVNEGETGIAGDWNFAVSCAKTALVTIAHQDDTYSKHYRREMVDAVNKVKTTLIGFSDYYELRETKEHTYETAKDNKLLRIKRLMLFPLKARCLQSSKFVRRRILSMGSAICCPSVMMNLEELKKKGLWTEEKGLFENNMRSNIDWQAWELLSREKGAFVYAAKPLMKHRIHMESTTSELIGEDGRKAEDLLMYRKFWPAWIANIIEHFYQNAEKSNRID